MPDIRADTKRMFDDFVTLRFMLTLSIAGATVLGSLMSGMAQAQPMLCGPHAEISAVLAEKYGEHPIGIGVSATGAAVELLSNKDSGTWSLLMTAPGGPTCLVANGENWFSAKPKPGRGT